MFERYIIVPNSLRNVMRDGQAVGFAVDLRIAYYRGLGLSMVEGFEVAVDGVAVDPVEMTLHVGGRTYRVADLESEIEGRWEFNEAATLFLRKPGGLTAGRHEVSVVEILRVSYMAEPARRGDRKVLETA